MRKRTASNRWRRIQWNIGWHRRGSFHWKALEEGNKNLKSASLEHGLECKPNRPEIPYEDEDAKIEKMQLIKRLDCQSDFGKNSSAMIAKIFDSMKYVDIYEFLSENGTIIINYNSI